MKKPPLFCVRVARELRWKYNRDLSSAEVWALLRGHPDIGWHEGSPHEIAWQLDQRIQKLEQPQWTSQKSIR